LVEKDIKLEDILFEEEKISIENTTKRTKDLFSKVEKEEKKIEQPKTKANIKKPKQQPNIYKQEFKTKAKEITIENKQSDRKFYKEQQKELKTNR